VKVILKADVRDLGRSGDLVEVKDGYARNFLLPRSLAVPATPGNLKDFQKRIAAAKEREARERASANDVADQLRGRRIVIIHRAAEGGTRLHGSVTSAEVAAAISKSLGREIDRRDVDLRQPIRALGEYQVNVKLMRGLTVPVRLTVAEKEPVEEPEAPAAETAPAGEPAAATAAV
jgi:large subunit ribosomal protein L9